MRIEGGRERERRGRQLDGGGVDRDRFLGGKEGWGRGGAGADSIWLCACRSARYECDPTTCVLPDCLVRHYPSGPARGLADVVEEQCASASPPGGLSPQDTPQFISAFSRRNSPTGADVGSPPPPQAFTADDAIQVYTRDAVNHFLAQRRNPNGCAPKMTYFASLSYTNYSMVRRFLLPSPPTSANPITQVTDWFVEGNEIADHTMVRPSAPSSSSCSLTHGTNRPTPERPTRPRSSATSRLSTASLESPSPPSPASAPLSSLTTATR